MIGKESGVELPVKFGFYKLYIQNREAVLGV